jgi:hypothetical protein
VIASYSIARTWFDFEFNVGSRGRWWAREDVEGEQLDTKSYGKTRFCQAEERLTKDDGSQTFKMYMEVG